MKENSDIEGKVYAGIPFQWEKDGVHMQEAMFSPIGRRLNICVLFSDETDVVMPSQEAIKEILEKIRNSQIKHEKQKSEVPKDA